MKAYRKTFGPMVILVLFVVAGFAQAATWNVPGDSATIQGGIALASYGDTVEVSAGTYVENITLKNGVALIDVGASTTTIDGDAAGSVITSSNCDVNTILDGFTITNGSAIYGGGMYNSLSSPTVTGCTFSGNTAGTGGGMDNYYSDTTLTNCILWSNSVANEDEIYNNSSTPVISYCDIAGCGGSGAWDSSFGTDGGGNIDDDPMFKDADGPDDFVGTEDDNLQLANNSPCIDAGDSNSVPPDYADLDEDGDTAEQTPLDLAGHLRFTDDPVMADTGAGTPPIVDMGAYERYEFCGSGEYQSPPGDITGPDGVPDCDVNLYDFAVIALHWLEYTGPQRQ